MNGLPALFMLNFSHLLLDGLVESVYILENAKFFASFLTSDRTAFMSEEKLPPLSRRERQIMDIIYQKGQATAADVLALLPDPPSYSTVRALLRILEEKGHLVHKREGHHYVFRPTVKREKVQRSAMKHLLHTFFDNSIEQASPP